MDKMMRAAIVTEFGKPLSIEYRPVPRPEPGKILVRVKACGVCHTDLHARDGYFPNLPYPIVCGHEGAGIVERIGSAVTDLAVGDKVVISFPWCGACEQEKPS